MSMDLEEQYDRIYRYCYFRLRDRELAEDVAQEAFLRFFDSGGYQERGQALRYLYTIARNLCIDEYRKKRDEILPWEAASLLEETADRDMQERMAESLSVKMALSQLSEEEREILLLRYVNQVPVHALCGFYGISRFALYRKTAKAVRALKERLGDDWE